MKLNIFFKRKDENYSKEMVKKVWALSLETQKKLNNKWLLNEDW